VYQQEGIRRQVTGDREGTGIRRQAKRERQGPGL
jgi:hypothetical protein